METRRKTLYVLPGANPGLVVRGNIDINNRPSVPNPQGGISSVFSASNDVVIKGRHYEMLFPTVIPVGGHYKVVSVAAAYRYSVRTGKHLGIFDTVAHANTYARKLHAQQARLMQDGRSKDDVVRRH